MNNFATSTLYWWFAEAQRCKFTSSQLQQNDFRDIGESLQWFDLAATFCRFKPSCLTFLRFYLYFINQHVASVSYKEKKKYLCAQWSCGNSFNCNFLTASTSKYDPQSHKSCLYLSVYGSKSFRVWLISCTTLTLQHSNFSVKAEKKLYRN